MADWFSEALADLDRAGLRRRRRTVTPLPEGQCEIDGRRLVNFAANDYLGLASDDRVRAAARAVLDGAVAGAGASALITGRTDWHERLEQELAEFEGTAAALLFPTGYAANAGTISALVGRGDVIFSDALNHASIIDGCRLSRAEVRVYRHGDIEQLSTLLKQSPEGRRRFIVTDSVFSMDGDIAPLRELSRIADESDALLIVDEAHATGVLGAKGRGACELLDVESPHVVRVGTLSKALGGMGGFVAGPNPLIELLWNRARTQVFSTALPPSICAAASASLAIIRNEPERRQRLITLSRNFRATLAESGVPIPATDVTPIVPIVVGDARRAVEWSARLEEMGLYVPAIRPPTVPEGSSRLRISLSAVHSSTALEQLTQSLIDCFADLAS